MSIRSFAHITRALLTAADKVEAKIPTATRKAIEQKLALADRINSYVPTATPLATAVVDALSRDVDPLTDPDVMRAHLAAFIDQVRHGFPDVTNQRVHDTLLESWPTIVGAFKVPFDKAGEQLREAHEVLTGAGIDELTQTAPSNSEALAVTWVRAHDARRTIETITSSLGSAAVLFSWPRWISDARMYDSHGEPTDHRFRTSPWDALGKGWTINLADDDEVEQRRADGAETIRQREAVFDEEQKRKAGRISNLSMR